MKFLGMWKRFYQRITRGWDDSETWSLDVTLCEWLAPRLERLRELQGKIGGCPGMCDSVEEWNEVLDKIEYAVNKNLDQSSCWEFEKEEAARVQEGFELLGKHMLCLWW